MLSKCPTLRPHPYYLNLDMHFQSAPFGSCSSLILNAQTRNGVHDRTWQASLQRKLRLCDLCAQRLFLKRASHVLQQHRRLRRDAHLRRSHTLCAPLHRGQNRKAWRACELNANGQPRLNPLLCSGRAQKVPIQSRAVCWTQAAIVGRSIP